MTPEMKEKCLNVDMRAFHAMHAEVKEEIRRALPEGDVELLQTDGAWSRFAGRAYPQFPREGCIYRIRPDYPTERAYNEYPIFVNGAYWCYELARGFSMNTVIDGMGRTNFAGIVYGVPGLERVYYSLNPEMGTPLRIRFWRE